MKINYSKEDFIKCWGEGGYQPQMLNRRTEPFSFLFLSDGKNNFEKIKNMNKWEV